MSQEMGRVSLDPGVTETGNMTRAKLKNHPDWD